jgi:ribosomal-protein-alanine N-acetyltransferase
MRQEVTAINGHTVLLRPLRESDLEESVRVWTPELRHMYGGSMTAPAASLADRRAGKRLWFERVQRGEEGHCFAIEVGGRYIGWAALYRFNQANRSAHWRGGIENSECWGRGNGTEAMQLMLRYGFDTLCLHRISLRVAAYNTRAIRCYEKCGFRLEGIERDSFLVDGEWHDDWLMAVLRDDWEESQIQRAADSLLVRSYRTSDYDAVLALWQAVGFSPDYRDSREALQRKLYCDRGPFLAAEVDGRLVGTALASWDGRRAWVYRLAVDPAHQGKGIGRRLMTELEAKLERLGAKSAALLVNPKDERAIRFYRRRGYTLHDDVGFMMRFLTHHPEQANGHEPH